MLRDSSRSWARPASSSDQRSIGGAGTLPSAKAAYTRWARSAIKAGVATRSNTTGREKVADFCTRQSGEIGCSLPLAYAQAHSSRPTLPAAACTNRRVPARTWPRPRSR